MKRILAGKAGRANITLIAGAAVTSTFVLAAVFAPWIAPCSPFDQDLFAGLAGPGADHLLGQDRLGRDIFTRIIYGARISLTVGFVTVGISVLLGTLLGTAAGFFGGRVDEIIMRTCDVFLAFPGILLAIAVMAVLGPSFINVVVALSLMGWTGFARLARGQTLSLREREFVVAAVAMGATPARIIGRHIIPNLAAPLTVEATFAVAAAVVGEAGLSFLGLGAQPPTPSWGAMLAEGRQFLLIAPSLTIWPGLAIMLTVLGINFLGDGLRDIMDPKSKRRGE
ncbi:MAG: ABC transporter permease [Nitrospinota bacterium]|nr:ABC transporter permease [Nitrospinota bacterium]